MSLLPNRVSDLMPAPFRTFLITTCMGIALGYALCHNAASHATAAAHTILIATSAAAVLATAALFVAYRRQLHRLASVALVLLGLSMGTARMAHYEQSLQSAFEQPAQAVTGIVITQPTNRPRHTSFNILTASRHQVAVSIWRADSLTAMDPRLGDIVRLQSGIRQPKPHRNPDAFDYDHWLWVQGIAGTVQVNADAVSRPSGASEAAHSLPYIYRIRIRALQWRQRVLAMLHNSDLSSETSTLLAAMTLGDRSDITSDMRTLYSEAGASHLLALSGLHLGIVMGLLLWLFNGRLRYSRWRGACCMAFIVLVWGFALFVGLPTSLVRAATMTTIWILAVWLSRNSSAIQHLLVAITAMLYLRPTYLFDVGAQLSCAAVAGILIGMPRFSALLNHQRMKPATLHLRRWHLLPAVKLLAVSVFAQLATMPLVVYYFHTISPYSPLFNLCYIPLTTVLIFGTIILLTLLAIGGFGAGIVATALNVAMSTQMDIMHCQASLPGATINVHLLHKARPQLICYDDTSVSALHIVLSPSESYLLASSSDTTLPGSLPACAAFCQQRLTAHPTITYGQQVLTVGTDKIAMLDAPYVLAGTAATAPELHIADTAEPGIALLYLCHNFRGSIGQLPAALRPRLLVVAHSLPYRTRQNIVAEARNLGISCYDIGRQGALRLSLPLSGK